MERFNEEELRYYQLLSKQFSSIKDVCTEIINLEAILNLPKPTEHFMSDLHGEYEAFEHILNNCSGVIKEKIKILFADTLTKTEMGDLATLVYYPKEKMGKLEEQELLNDTWYKETLNKLIMLCRRVSVKYTRSKIRKALPQEYAYIIDELLHEINDENNYQAIYRNNIIDTIIEIDEAKDFIISLTKTIKRLAVDRLHIIGDIYDRGPRPDSIIDMLMSHHNVDIQWGNHDLLWMGAAAGNEACIAAVIKNSVKYNNIEVLEQGYGITLRNLCLFSMNYYKEFSTEMEAMLLAITIILLKLEGQLIIKHPEYQMNERLLLDKVTDNKISMNNNTYELSNFSSNLINDNCYELTKEERLIMDELKNSFINSKRLNKHVNFLYNKGSMYLCFNGNLLFHGCVPLNEDGEFENISIDNEVYQGKALLDTCDRLARIAYYKKDAYAIDYMWYLWSGYYSPLSGRNMKTFERSFIEEESTWIEKQNPYFSLINDETSCLKILDEFNLSNKYAHIINGHTPIKTMDGENPIKNSGKAIVIDGGFCLAYHPKTGIAGYTLIANSHGLRIKAHSPFKSVERVLDINSDIHSSSEIVEVRDKQIMVRHSDDGIAIQKRITDLKLLLYAYKEGIIIGG